MTAIEIMESLFDAAVANGEYVQVGVTDEGVALFDTAD